MERNIPYYVHLIADFVVDRVIEDTKKIERILFTAARKANNTPLKAVVHKFSPQGFTAVILLAESHISIHSWPEYKYIAVDIFTCGKKTKPHKALEYLKEKFYATQVKVQEVRQG